MTLRRAALEQMGIACYRARPASLHNAVDDAAAVRDASSADAHQRDLAALKESLSPDPASSFAVVSPEHPIEPAKVEQSSSAEKLGESGSVVPAKTTSAFRAAAACDYLYAITPKCLLFTLSETGFTPESERLFAAVSRALQADCPVPVRDRWSPMGTGSDRSRTLKTLLVSLAESATDISLLVMGQAAAADWSDADWDLIQGSRESAEAPFSDLRFGPALDEMTRSPYLKAQLWQLIRDLRQP